MTVKQSWLITFPYERPPLTANQRMHWRQRAALTKEVRERTAFAGTKILRGQA